MKYDIITQKVNSEFITFLWVNGEKSKQISKPHEIGERIFGYEDGHKNTFDVVYMGKRKGDLFVNEVYKQTLNYPEYAIINN